MAKVVVMNKVLFEELSYILYFNFSTLYSQKIHFHHDLTIFTPKTLKVIIQAVQLGPLFIGPASFKFPAKKVLYLLVQPFLNSMQKSSEF